jgi:hypothetical protein
MVLFFEKSIKLIIINKQTGEFKSNLKRNEMKLSDLYTGCLLFLPLVHNGLDRKHLIVNRRNENSFIDFVLYSLVKCKCEN